MYRYIIVNRWHIRCRITWTNGGNTMFSSLWQNRQKNLFTPMWFCKTTASKCNMDMAVPVYSRHVHWPKFVSFCFHSEFWLFCLMGLKVNLFRDSDSDDTSKSLNNENLSEMNCPTLFHLFFGKWKWLLGECMTLCHSFCFTFAFKLCKIKQLL